MVSKLMSRLQVNPFQINWVKKKDFYSTVTQEKSEKSATSYAQGQISYKGDS